MTLSVMIVKYVERTSKILIICINVLYYVSMSNLVYYSYKIMINHD